MKDDGDKSDLSYDDIEAAYNSDREARQKPKVERELSQKNLKDA